MKKLLIPALLGYMAISACSHKDATTPTTTTPPAVTDVTTFMATVDSLSEFATAIKQTSFTNDETSGGITVFAPGNEAIGDYNPNAKTTGKDLSATVVKDHIVKGLLKKTDLVDGKTFTTLSGKTITVSVRNGVIYLNGIQLTGNDLQAGKQLLHTIAGILSAKPGQASVNVYDATQWSPTNRRGVLTAGATIKLYTTRQDYLSNQPAYTAETNANGVAQFKDIPEGSYFVVATKADMSNIWDNGDGKTLVSDTLFQSASEITNAAIQQNAAPGDFRFSDLNQDGIINNDDKAEAPFNTITISSAATTNANILIGYTANHNYAQLSSLDAGETLLKQLAAQLDDVNKRLVITDGLRAQDSTASCSVLSTGWCDFSNHTYTAQQSTVNTIWQNEYKVILQLNRLIMSMNNMLPTGDTVAISAAAHTLRAFAYSQLYTYFGGLPVVKGLSIPTDVSRSSSADTYNFIKSDLQVGLQAPTTWDAGQRWKPTTDAARALLARLALNEKDYQSALTYSNAIIQSGRYSLNEKPLNDTSNSETIWYLAFSYPADFAAYFTRGAYINIRFSEVLLINAEANIQTGNLSSAQVTFNMLMNAHPYLLGGPVSTLRSQAEAMFNVQNIRHQELYLEGTSFPTLSRWDGLQRLNGYKPSISLLPIPVSVITTYPNIVQNPGY